MTMFFAVIGVALVVGLWAIYARLGLLADLRTVESQKNIEMLTAIKMELTVVWVALSESSEKRGARREEYGLGPLHNFDMVLASYCEPFWDRYKGVQEELEKLDSRNYTDAGDRERKKKQIEELRLQLRSLDGSATPEQKVEWDKVCEERDKRIYKDSGGKQK